MTGTPATSVQPGSGQQMINQFVDSTRPVTRRGCSGFRSRRRPVRTLAVTDTRPTADCWNLAAIEIRSA